MSDRILYLTVAARIRLQAMPAQAIKTLRDQTGNDLISTGMVIAGVLILGTALVLAVKGPVTSWLNTLLGSNCLNGAAAGTTGVGCP
ncbi:MAG: hypothetical protein ACYCS7_16005 [Acidimicrobiales bacterium]